jgi:hypothetical protein
VRASRAIELSRLRHRAVRRLRLILAGERAADSANRERGKQRCAADSQPTRPELLQARPTLVVRF